MLADFPYPPKHDPVVELLFGSRCERLAEGVYDVPLNFNHTIGDMILDQWSIEFPDESISVYGVCDTWQQIIKKWPELLDLDRRFVILVTEMRREDEPPSGGWRWHKWGAYIGDHHPQHEYLYDEKSIESVFVYWIGEYA